MSEFAIRIIVSVIGVLFLIGVLYLGNPYVIILMYIFSLIGLYELNRALKNKDLGFNYLLGSLLVTSMFFEIYFFDTILFSIVLGFFILSINFLISDTSIVNVSLTLFVSYYLVNGFTSLHRVGDMRLTILIFLIAFATDSFAYILGKSFGKRKLAAEISPNKSIEGAIGGILGCLLICLLYINYLNIGNINLSLVIILIFASIIGQIGDLFASKIKRELGIKDYGKILPGHGGILDRFDSILFVGPYVLLVSSLI